MCVCLCVCVQRDSTNQWRCGYYYNLSSNYLLQKKKKSACRQLTIPDSMASRWENANSEKSR